MRGPRGVGGGEIGDAGVDGDALVVAIGHADDAHATDATVRVHAQRAHRVDLDVGVVHGVRLPTQPSRGRHSTRGSRGRWSRR